MKKIILLCVLSITVFKAIYSQNWEYSAVLKSNEIKPVYTAIDEDKNFFTLSEFKDTAYVGQEAIISNGIRDLVITKYDNSGNLLWYNHIRSAANMTAGGLAISKNNSVTIAGNFMNTIYFSDIDSLVSTGSNDLFIATYNINSGDLVDNQHLGKGIGNSFIKDIEFDNDNNLIFCGFYLDTLFIDDNFGLDTLIGSSTIAYSFAAKLNSSGSVMWTKNIPQSTNSCRLLELTIDNTGYYFGGYVAGSVTLDLEKITSQGSLADVYFYKTDFNGNGEWVRKVAGSDSETIASITTDNYNNLYFLGSYKSSSLTIDSTSTSQAIINGNVGGWDTYIGKYNRSGTLQWIITKGGTLIDAYNDISISGDIIYASGTFTEEIIFNNDTLTTTSDTNQDVFLAALNSIGDPISGISIKGEGDLKDAGVLVNSDDDVNAYIAGYYQSSEITIGDSVYTNLVNGQSQFFAKYTHPFKAAFTNENKISCFGQSDGMVTVTPYFGVPPYSYSWTKDGAPISEIDSIAEGLNAGLYSVSVTDNRDSVAVVQVNLNNPSNINIGYTVSDVSCYNGSNGEIDITVSGGNNGYKYTWAGGTGLNPTVEDQTGLTATNYSVTVTDKNGCTASEIITVAQPGAITFFETVVVSTNADVDTGRIDLVISGGTPPFTDFYWEGPNGYISTDDSIANLNGGNYSVTVTDANLCLADTTFLVPNDSLFIGYMTLVQDVSCGNLTNGQAGVSSNRHPGSFEYIWIDLQDSTRVGGSFASISALDSSDYRVYIVDAVKEDTTSVDFTIKKPNLLVANSIAANPTCNGTDDGFINAIISGGTLPYSYDWSNSSTNEDLTDIKANGTYTLTVTDANNCTAETSETLEDPEVLQISMDKIDPLCRDELNGEATANITGGVFPYIYVWDDPGNQTEQTATDLEAGTYFVSVTDQNGCTIISSVTLNNPTLISILGVDSSNISCYGLNNGWIKIIPTGGSGSYTYDWGHTGLDTDSIGNLSSGNYTVTVNDVNNCEPVVESVSINEPPELIIDIDTTDVSCQGFANGVISVNVTGGSEAYSYSWGHTTSNISQLGGLSGGTYNLTVSDGSCPDEVFAIPVNEPAKLLVSVDKEDITCYNEGDGSIGLTISGGSESYDISWSHTTEKVASLSSLSAGKYNVTVNDGNCPVVSETIELTEPGEFSVAGYDTINLTAIGARDGKITIHVAGGVEPYRYLISGTTVPQLDSVFNNLAAGEYTVIVNDANNCGPIESDTIELKEPTSGVKNYWDESNISYYPNPADDKVTIEINNLKKNSVDLKVVTSMGSLLINEKIEIPNNKNAIELKIGHLSQGVYFILIDNIRVKTPLIVK